MKSIIQLFGVLVAVMGIILLINPDLIYDWFTDNIPNTSIFLLAIITRFALGTLLIIYASASRFPKLLKVIGFLSVLAALAFIIMGHERFQDFLTALLPDVRPYYMVSSMAAIILGSLLVYAFVGKQEPA